jgi:hypothetical protein
VLGPDLDPFTRQAEDDAAVDDESGHGFHAIARPMTSPRCEGLHGSTDMER